MSQKTVTHIVERTCEACGKAKQWDMVLVNEEMVNEMGEWYTIVRKVLLNGRPEDIMVQACSLECVPAAAIKLALPSQSEEPPIDLDSLRAGDLSVN